MSETGEMRGAVRADVAILDVGGGKCVDFLGKSTDLRENLGAEA